MSTRGRVVLRHVMAIIVLLGAVRWLLHVGPSHPAIPSLSVDSVRVWIDQRDAVTLAFAIVRLETLGLAVYLLAVTMLSGLVRWLSLPRAARLVDRLTLPVVRGMLGGAAALGVLATPPTLRPPAPAVTATTLPPPTPSEASQATLHLLPATPDAAPAPTPPPAPAVVAVPDDNSWLVQPGDSLWSIARQRLVDTSESPVDDRSIAVMWRALIDLNRERLVDPDDPDLIFAGQVLELPVDAG